MRALFIATNFCSGILYSKQDEEDQRVCFASTLITDCLFLSVLHRQCMVFETHDIDFGFKKKPQSKLLFEGVGRIARTVDHNVNCKLSVNS